MRSYGLEMKPEKNNLPQYDNTVKNNAELKNNM